MLGRSTFCAALAGLAALAGIDGAQAQQPWPNRPINFIASSGVGGLADFGARLYAEFISRNVGQRVLVENKSGAGGQVAWQFLKDQAPDGYTIMQMGSGMPEILVHMQELNYDPVMGYTYITPMFQSETYVVVRSDLPVTSLKEYVDMAKTKPGSLSFGDTGASAPPGLMMNMVMQHSGAPIVVVHYRASPELMGDLLGSRLDSTGSSYQVFAPALQDKQVRILAINATARSTRFPDVPTLAEAGFPATDVGTVWGVVGPPGMPKALVDRINAEFVKASKDPELIKKLYDQDISPITMAADSYQQTTAASSERLGKIIKQLGLRVQ